MASDILSVKITRDGKNLNVVRKGATGAENDTYTTTIPYDEFNIRNYGLALWFADRENKIGFYDGPYTKSDINLMRSRRLENGISLNVSNLTVPIKIDGTSEVREILTNLALASTIKIQTGDKSTIQYRDGNDNTHTLTNEQVIEIWSRSVKFVSMIYQASWSLKAMKTIPSDMPDDKYWLLETI